MGRKADAYGSPAVTPEDRGALRRSRPARPQPKPGSPRTSRTDTGGTTTPRIEDGGTGAGTTLAATGQCGAIRTQSPRS